MCRVKNTIKGFTMLELILALAIGAMFSAIFFQFFFTHQKALNSTVIKSQLQMDMQLSTDYLNKSAMETSRISFLNGGTLASEFTSQKLGDQGMIFSVENSDHIEQYSYKYKVVGKNLYYTKSGSPEKIICNDISYVKITPIDSKSFAECSGIVLEIELIGVDGKITYNTINSIYFRNKN